MDRLLTLFCTGVLAMAMGKSGAEVPFSVFRLLDDFGITFRVRAGDQRR